VAQDFAKYEGKEHRYGELDYVCDIVQIPAPDASFDCILCTEVLEHVPHPGRAIGEFARLLRPGGRLILTAPLGSGIHMAPYQFYGGFTRHWYELFLAEHGFDLLTCEPNGGFFKLYGQESQRFLFMLTPRSRAARLLWAPLRLVATPWFRVLLPLMCHFLDRLDREKHFTAGYFVVAAKRNTAAQTP
jgi:SAM-dependent methyltransferase